MTPKVWLAAGLAVISGTVHAQNIEKNVAFQFFNAEVPPPGIAPAGAFRVAEIGRPVAGKPFSATEIRRTRQTLGDGTHIDKTDIDKYFRDGEGRTRIERENGAGITISDPQTGATTESASGRNRVIMLRSPGPGLTLGEKSVTLARAAEPMHQEMLDKLKTEGVPGIRTAIAAQTMSFRAEADTAMGPTNRGNSEDLGDQIVNGVLAHGTRTTITIPQGEIGNDREIKIVSERWYSSDLQMTVKSSNNDPRFGETTYELTNIVQGAQDPTLFQMPKH